MLKACSGGSIGIQCAISEQQPTRGGFARFFTYDGVQEPLDEQFDVDLEKEARCLWRCMHNADKFVKFAASPSVMMVGLH